MYTNLTLNKHIKLKNSILWLKNSFLVFREHPLQFLCLEIIAFLVTLLPFLGAFFTPLIMARFMYCSNKVVNHDHLSIREIFANFFTHKNVVRLGFINFLLNALILFGQYFLDNNNTDVMSSASVKSAINLTLLSIPTIILTMSMWLSPAICLFHRHISPKIAMKLSIQACFVNILTLLAFSILLAGLSAIIMLPLFYFGIIIWNSMHNLYVIIPFGIVAYIICMVWFAILNISTYFIYSSSLKPELC